MHFVNGSKYRAETVSIVVSFSDLLTDGDYIVGTPVISVTVESGTDPSPADLLYLGVSVTKGSVVTQRFRLGIEGVIYHIVFQIATHLGDTLEKACFLAIRPNEGAAVPTWLPLWESTQLYPVTPLSENIQGALVITGGQLYVIIINYICPPENMQGSIIITGGYLRSPIVAYICPPEDIQGALIITGGTLVVVQIPYTFMESMAGAISIISGTLVTVVISYNYSSENMQGALTITGGTLV